MSSTIDPRTVDKCIKAIRKPIKLASVKHRNNMLEYAADDKAEAYEIGVEETQRELVNRLAALLHGATP